MKIRIIAVLFLLGGALVLAGCGAAQPETITVIETVIVEKEVEVIVEVEVPVEAEVEGSKSQLEVLIKELHIGPRSSSVKSVNVNWLPFEGKFKIFEITF